MMRDVKLKLLSGGVLRSLSVILLAIFSLFTMPILVKNLGNEGYSLWSLCSTFVGYCLIVDFGLSRSVQQAVAFEYGRSANEESMNALISTGFFMFSGLSILVFCLSLIIAATHFLWVDASHTYQFVGTILILGFTASIELTVRLFGAILYTKVRHDILVSGQLTETIVRLSLIVFAVTHGEKLITLSLITMMTSLMFYAWVIFWALREFSTVTIRSKFVSKAVFVRLFQYSVPAFVSDLSSYLQTQIIPLLVVKLFALDYLVFVSIAQRLVAYSNQFIQSWSGMLTAIFSRLSSEKNENKTQYVLSISTSFVCLLLCWMISNILIFEKGFILVWLGNDYLRVISLLNWFLLGSFFSFLFTVSKEMLYGNAFHKGLAILHLSELIQIIICSYFLSLRYDVEGIAMGFSLVMIINEVLFVPFLLKLAHIPIMKTFKDCFSIVLMWSVMTALLIYLMKSIVIESFVVLLLWILIINVLYIPLIMISLSRDLKLFLFLHLKKGKQS